MNAILDALVTPSWVVIALSIGLTCLLAIGLINRELDCRAQEKAERRRRTVPWHVTRNAVDDFLYKDSSATQCPYCQRYTCTCEDATWAHEQAIAEKAIKAQIKANLPAIPQCPYCRRYASWCVCVWEEAEIP